MLSAAVPAGVAVVAALHVVFFVLESLLWTKPFGRRVFGLSRELSEATKSLALNQGVCNLFLAAGLIWSLFPSGYAFQLRQNLLCPEARVNGSHGPRAVAEGAARSQSLAGGVVETSGAPRERIRQIETGANLTLETLRKLLPHPSAGNRAASPGHPGSARLMDIYGVSSPA